MFIYRKFTPRDRRSRGKRRPRFEEKRARIKETRARINRSFSKIIFYVRPRSPRDLRSRGFTPRFFETRGLVLHSVVYA
jgi:hypothetical protein